MVNTISTIKKERSTPLEHQKWQDECLKMIYDYAPVSEIYAFWRDKGYTEGRIGVEVHKCYEMIKELYRDRWPYVKDLHIAVYNKIVKECRLDGDRKNEIKCLENIERLAGITDYRPENKIEMVIVVNDANAKVSVSPPENNVTTKELDITINEETKQENK